MRYKESDVYKLAYSETMREAEDAGLLLSDDELKKFDELERLHLAKLGREEAEKEIYRISRIKARIRMSVSS